MKNVITEIKNTLKGTNSRITDVEERISEVEDIIVEINEGEREKAEEMRITSEISVGSDINLVALKVATLNQQGYNFRGIDHNTTFLK